MDTLANPSYQRRFPAPTVAPPAIEEAIEWIEEGDGCEAIDGCWVEADGWCPHGYPSWLLFWGMI